MAFLKICSAILLWVIFSLPISAIGIVTASIGANAAEFETTAKQAFLIDADSGTILLQKDIDANVEPASLTKLMTLEVLFNMLEEKTLDPNALFNVSEHAWRTGGAPSGRATVFAEINSDVPVDILVKSIAIETANDSCIVLAEGIAGSESGFAKLMNQRAKIIGLEGSTFKNPMGYEDVNHTMTIRDIMKLASHIIETYPNQYKYFSIPSLKWNEIEQRNHNPLLVRNLGVDGMMMGYSEKSGYMMVATAKRKGQRLIAVLAGIESEKQRIEQVVEVLNWGYSNFEKRIIFDKDEVVGYAKVYGGQKNSVALAGQGQIGIYLPVEGDHNLKARVRYEGPIQPPVTKGQQLAELEIVLDREVLAKIPLYSAENIEQGNLSQRAIDGLQELGIRMLSLFPYRFDWDKLEIEPK